MKKFLFTLIAAATMAASPALAETTIGVVNVAKIMKDSKAATAVRTQLEAKQKAFQAELDAKEKELQTEDQALVKMKDTADKAAFAEKVKAFQTKAAAAQAQVRTKKESLDKAFAAALEEIQKAAVDVTKDVATEKKINLIVSSAQVLYGDPALDVTNDVLKRLDAKLPTVTLKF